MATSLDGHDLLDTFGFAVSRVLGAQDLPDLKPPLGHDWKDEDGQQPFTDAKNIVIKPGDIILEGHIVGSDITDMEQRISNLKSLILLPGERSLITPHSSLSLDVRYEKGFRFRVLYDKTNNPSTTAKITIPLVQPVPNRITLVEAPTIVQDGGNQVTITTGTFGTLIYYTIDGSTPDSTDTLYSAPFDNSALDTIKAIVYYDTLTSTVTTHVP